MKKHGLVQVSINLILNFYLSKYLSFLDCISDFSNFTALNCSNNTNVLQCGKNQLNYGLCIESTYLNELNETLNATCNTPTELVTQIGIWKPTFPSEDYWMFKFFLLI